MNGFKIISYGYKVGETLVTNNDFNHLDTSDEWIRSRTGIITRYLAPASSANDLALAAVNKALAGQNLAKISLVIVATMSAKYVTPALSNEIITKFKLKGYGFDLNAACSGFIYALNTANALLKEGQALVVGVDKMSNLLDPNDRKTMPLFGDAACAFLIEKANLNYASYLKSIPDEVHILEGPKRVDMPLFKPAETRGYLEMNGQEVFKFALMAIKDVLSQLTYPYDLIIFHQANWRIIDYACKSLKIPKEKCYLNLTKYGNTSAASIPLALAEALETKEFRGAKRILLVGFGAGLSYGGIYFERGEEDVIK